jgi:hypothetical protein
MINKKKIDIILDNSEFYDFELYTDLFDVKIDIIIDDSEFYDFILTDENIDESIDIILDLSEFYDFILTDVDIDINELVEMTPVCIDCDDAIVSLDSEYGFLLTDDYKYIETVDGGYLQYH